MDWAFLAELLVVLVVIAIGARQGGIALGLWGGVGVLVLTLVFGATPSEPPIDVMLIILAVISATAAMEAAGGIDWLVGVAERIIRKFPQHITIVAPLVSYMFTFGAGTGHVFYPLLPVIHDVAHDNGIRPERPIAVATIASQQAITASPVSAAMAALLVILEPEGMTLIGIMAIAVPATLIGVIVAAVLSYRRGVELADDPVFQERVAQGLVEPIPALGMQGPLRHSAAEASAPVHVDSSVDSAEEESAPVSAAGRISALLFLAGVASIIVLGAFPALRPLVGPEGEAQRLNMSVTIEITMLTVAALIVTITGVEVERIPRTASARAGLVALVGIFGLAWLGQTLIDNNLEVVVGGLTNMVTAAPWTFAIGLFLASILLFSQAATTRALMPLGVALGIGAPQLVAMWPAVNGYFFMPTYGTLIAAINFDLSGTTRIGRWVLNHSFMMPGMVATVVGISAGLAISGFF